MPTLFSSGITVSAGIATRIQAATGAANIAEAEAYFKNLMKQTVVAYEASQAAETEEANVIAANDAKRAAIEAAESAAESEIVLG